MKRNSKAWAFAIMLVWAPPALRAQPASDLLQPGNTSSATTQPATRPAVSERARNGRASSAHPSGNDLTDLSLEDLMNVEVTSVSRQKQKIADAAAAVFVIGSDDIERSGLNSIPELLRLVPGLDVAQINSNTWAIGSRGFNQQYDTSLLVMMDGRTLYNPGSSGVYWNAQDYILQDLDRIEVVRGPGSTLWGANAVNGVISIETKNAMDTQGWLFDSEAGNRGENVSLRYGGKLDSDTYYRVYGKYRGMDSFDNSDGSSAADAWQSELGGLRIDHAGGNDSYTIEVQGYYDRQSDEDTAPSFTPPFVSTLRGNYNTTDNYILGRWIHTLSEHSDLMVQAYYDYLSYADPAGYYAVNTFDLDVQHRFPIGSRQEVIWGGGARLQSDVDTSQTGVVVFNPSRSQFNIVNGFVQDDVAIIPDRLHMILGTKLEDNSRTGLEYEPTIRGIWTPGAQNSVWAAFSRAVRTPSEFQEHATLVTADFPVPGGVGESELLGNTGLVSEDLFAYDAGYRFKPTESVSVDVAGFYNDYENLLSASRSVPSPILPSLPPPNIIFPVPYANNMRADSYGLEITVNWKISPAWRLSGSYTSLQTHFRGGDAVTAAYLKGGSPRNQAQLHSYYDITRDLQFNASAYYVDGLSLGNVPSYIRLDLGIAWHPTPAMQISFGVQNLLNSEHREFSSPNGTVNSSEVPRTFYGELSYKF